MGVGASGDPEDEDSADGAEISKVKLDDLSWKIAVIGIDLLEIEADNRESLE